MKKYLAEMIGTFALVFCGTGAIIINEISNGAVTQVGIAITFGLIILAMIYAVGNISGAHLNPAVTFGFAISKKINTIDILPYILSQIAGAFLASFILKFLFPDNLNLGATIPAGSNMQSFILEIILSFFLMFVILNVANEKIIAEIAIGSVVGLEAMFAGPICGASMNPARSIAPAFVSGNIHSLWIYIAAPLIGSFLAVVIYKIMSK